MNKTLTLFATGLLLTGMVAAAPQLTDAGAVPGSFLYPVDQTVEDAELFLASAPVIGIDAAYAKVKANIAEERLAEATALKKGVVEEAEDLLEEYEEQMAEAANVAE